MAGNREGPKSKASNASHISKADRERQPGEVSGSAGQKGSGEFSAEGEQEKKKKRNPVETIIQAQKAAKAVKTVSKAGNLMSRIQQFFRMAQAFFQNLGAVMQAVFAAVAMGLFGAAVALAAVIVTSTTPLKDDYREDCIVYLSKGAIGSGLSPADSSAIKLRMEKQIYSVLYYYGCRPEQIFAVLGNWNQESGIDPTGVETIHDEPFRIGPKKQEAVAADFVLKRWNLAYANAHPKIVRNGIGLGQWTNDRTKGLLRYAQLAGKQVTDPSTGRSTVFDQQTAFQWYDVVVQLAYALDPSSLGDSGAGWFRRFADQGRLQSTAQSRYTDGSLEFSGDSDATSKYGDVSAVVLHATAPGEEDTAEADSYYDGYVPLTDGSGYSSDTCRDNAESRAAVVCDQREAAGAYDTTDEYGNTVIDQGAYKADFAKCYRFALYENMVKKYTYEFMDGWEGIHDSSYGAREKFALQLFYQWYGTDSILTAGAQEPNETAGDPDFFKCEEGYARSVLRVMDVTKDADFSLTQVWDIDTDMSRCRQIKTEVEAGNMADTACLLAWPTAALSMGNNGTERYRYIHDCVIPGDSVYQSCDRTVCTAVRWSGYDDSFPQGATLNIMQYLVTSPRWTELDWGGDKNQLRPGDVLIKKDSVATGATDEGPGDAHHVVMYVGESAAELNGKKVAEELGVEEPLPGSCVVHGSYGERSPAIDVWHDSFNEFHAFRCTYPMDPGKSRYTRFYQP